MARNSKIWYVDFPLYQYVEDVKALAREANLRIVDATFDNGDGVKDHPQLTLKATTEKPKRQRQKTESGSE